MQGFTPVDSVCVMLPQWVRMRKPVTTGGTSRRTRERVAKWAAKRATAMDKSRFYMGYIGGKWVPIGTPGPDCEWWCVADDSWHGININVSFYKKD